MKEKTFYKFLSFCFLCAFIVHSISFERSWFLYLGGYALGICMLASYFLSNSYEETGKRNERNR